ncbi:MAG TPA: prepilin-type N-terminal cleavage/methylation domain-containing protein [Verrucomicrobiae bacterium]|jgi:prepilin-type N-terminal cleavage/methylation domain-containing protein|nr:prepilin-type N-terminal cleavage/methylation domain-containing protein [Verrucomicrobiae bacterium]
MNLKMGRDNRGFTLVEMMITVGISSMLAYSIFAVMRAGQEQSNSSQLQMTIYDSAREGLYKMTQELRLSAPDRVTITNGGAGIQFRVPDPDNPTNADFSINWNGSTLVTYSVGGTGGTQILRTTSTGQNTVIANDVVGINFAGNGAQPTLVTVTMSVQRTMNNNRVIPANPLQVTGQAEIRNA